MVKIPDRNLMSVKMDEGLAVGEGMESPLDVLSRAATMVEAVNTSGSSTPGSRPADTEDKHSPPSLVNK